MDAPAPTADCVSRCRGTVCVRPFRDADIEPLAAAVQASLDDLRPWLPWAHAAYDRAEARTWVESRPTAWANGEAYSFAIVHARTDRFLGGVGINRIDGPNRVGNLGYWVRTEATGRGVATTAACLAATIGVEEIGLRRLDILVPVENEASRRVAEKIGATAEGTLRNRLRVGGTAHDAVLYGLLPEALPDRVPTAVRS
ncbi:MAG: GNAT family N-acetyltransferase [Salinivenus sp.]